MSGTGSFKLIVPRPVLWLLTHQPNERLKLQPSGHIPQARTGEPGEETRLCKDTPRKSYTPLPLINQGSESGAPGAKEAGKHPLLSGGPSASWTLGITLLREERQLLGYQWSLPRQWSVICGCHEEWEWPRPLEGSWSHGLAVIFLKAPRHLPV